MTDLLPLLGVVIGGGITYVVMMTQLRVQSQRLMHREQLARFESIHKALSAVEAGVSNLSMQVVMQSAHNKGFEPENLKGINQFNELRMFVDFYAPQVALDVDTMAAEFVKVGAAAVEVIGRTSQAEKTAAAEAASAAATRLAEAVKVAKEKLNGLARHALATSQ